MNDDFRKQYLGEFPPPDRLLYDLAKEYDERCEAYDRTVCTGPIGPEGGILPATVHERGLISLNAARVQKELIARAEQQGRKREDVIRAIQKYPEAV